MRLTWLVVLVACGGPKASTSTPPPAPLANVAKAEPAPASGLAVTEIEPAIGDAEGGTYCRIKGSRFIADGPRDARVYFGSRQGTIIRFASDGELIVEAPGGTPGEVVDVVVVFEPGGDHVLRQAFKFVDKR